MTELDNTPRLVAALNLDKRMCSALEIFFRDRCEDEWLLTLEDYADVSIVDMDAYKAVEVYEKHCLQYPKRPVILMSMRWKAREDALLVSKPLQSEQILKALRQARKHLIVLERIDKPEQPSEDTKGDGSALPSPEKKKIDENASVSKAPDSIRTVNSADISGHVHAAETRADVEKNEVADGEKTGDIGAVSDFIKVTEIVETGDLCETEESVDVSRGVEVVKKQEDANAEDVAQNPDAVNFTDVAEDVHSGTVAEAVENDDISNVTQSTGGVKHADATDSDSIADSVETSEASGAEEAVERELDDGVNPAEVSDGPDTSEVTGGAKPLTHGNKTSDAATISIGDFETLSSTEMPEPARESQIDIDESPELELELIPTDDALQVAEEQEHKAQTNKLDSNIANLADVVDFISWAQKKRSTSKGMSKSAPNNFKEFEFGEGDISLYVGKTPDIDLGSRLQIATALYQPEYYLQGFVQRACRMAGEQKTNIRLEGYRYSMTVLHKTRQIHVEVGERQVFSLAAMPLNSDDVTVTAISKGQLAQVVNPKALFSIDSFVWELALRTAHGRVPSNTDLQAPVYLKRWPNMTRLTLIPHALRIAALWINQPRSLIETARVLEIPQRYVFSFYSAAYALGLASQQCPNAVLNDQRDAAAPKRNRGLLQRILGRLRKGGA